jgi:hypothetical protein
MVSSERARDTKPGTMPGGYAVETSGLVKRFGDRTAVDRAGSTARSGKLHRLTR